MPAPGDLFVFPLTATEWLSGRVLLDVKEQCVKRQLIAPNSQLGFYDGFFLIEIYATPTPEPRIDTTAILVPSLFVPGVGFNGTWAVHGHRVVDPTTVDFPASLLERGSSPYLQWGELLLPTDLTRQEGEALGARATIHGTMKLRALCLVALGRSDEVPPEFPNLDILALGAKDLRFNPEGPAVFARAGLARRRSYFEEALERGFDMRRFYT